MSERAPVDMSPEAITARLRTVCQLRRLALSLARARRIEAPGRGGASVVREGDPLDGEPPPEVAPD